MKKNKNRTEKELYVPEKVCIISYIMLLLFQYQKRWSQSSYFTCDDIHFLFLCFSILLPNLSGDDDGDDDDDDDDNDNDDDN
jgi:hypothetical protein